MKINYLLQQRVQFIKKDVLIARNVFEKSFTASASIELILMIGILSSIFEDLANIEANISASLDAAPTIILDGNRLSCNALLSLKNSGEKKILLVLNFLFNLSVNPRGTVDLLTMLAEELTSRISSIDETTLLVSKNPVFVL